MSNNQVALMAERLSIEPQELHNVVLNTLMPSGKQPTNEQFVSFLAVANEYKLNPLTKEIYAFPAKGGGIQPIVSIDGWLKIINCHPRFNGMQFRDAFDDKGSLIAVTCCMYRKDRDHPTEVTEYLAECDKGTEPWRKWPARMLRHKATIQAARYAFGFSGIVDPDEGERIQDSQVNQPIDMGAADVELQAYPAERFATVFPRWAEAIRSGAKTAEQIIQMAQSKGALSESQLNDINGVTAE